MWTSSRRNDSHIYDVQVTPQEGMRTDWTYKKYEYIWVILNSVPMFVWFSSTSILAEVPRQHQYVWTFRKSVPQSYNLDGGVNAK